MEHLNYKYLEFIDVLISEYITHIDCEQPEAFAIGDYNIEVPIKKFLFQRLAMDGFLKELFTANVQVNTEIVHSFILNWLLLKYGNAPKKKVANTNIHNQYFNQYKTLLEPYKNKIVYYALHERFLKFMLPILSKLEKEIVILCENEIPDDLEYSDNISLIELSHLPLSQHKGDFLQHNFPWVFHMFNTLHLFIELLQPSAILVIEGNHPQFESLAILGKQKSIPVLCLQQGWPGILHTGFKDMQYSHFLCWGPRFCELFKPMNPLPHFLITGYPFKTVDNNSKSGIAFFLQAPILISSPDANNSIVAFALFCAGQFPDRKILIRAHPEYPLSNHFVQQAANYDNILLTSQETHTLFEVFEKSLISVSIFSSTIIESLAHGTIPFIFNPGLMPNYNPNLEAEGLGVEVKSLEEAKNQMIKLTGSPSWSGELIKQINTTRKNYFNMIGSDAIMTTVDTITKICDES